MGHVYRSLNLAKKLKQNGHKIIFLTSEKNSKIIFSQIFDCVFSRRLDNYKTKFFLKKFSPDIIILDKLNETKINLNILRKYCSIVGIDYIGKNKNLIEYGINILYPKSGLSKNSFSSLDFAILDKKFQHQKKKFFSKKVKSILILQGGADTYCFTPKIIQAVLNLDEDYKISVVLGPSFNCHQKLNSILKQTKKSIKIYQNVKNMSSLMQRFDFAITAAGNTLLELACLGIPTLIICAEKFELETAKLLERKGFGINAGFGKNLSIPIIHSHLIEITTNYNSRKKMHKIGPKLIDGKGASRISKILQTIHYEE